MQDIWVITLLCTLKRPVKASRIDIDKLRNSLLRNELNPLNNDINESADAVVDALYKCSKESEVDITEPEVDLMLQRWERLLNDTNDARVWQAIDWKREYREVNDHAAGPDSDQFKTFFEDLFNPPNVGDLQSVLNDNIVTIPVLVRRLLLLK